jgi:predicted nucleic acid-binding protein
MGVADAAHVAFTEYAGADFVTVDDRLLKQYQRLGLKVWSGSPLAYCDKESFK